MRASHRLLTAVMMLAACGARPAFGQTAEEEDRFRINVDGGAQLTSTAFDTTATRSIYLENASIGTKYEIRRGPTIDGGVSVTVVRDFGVGLVLSGFTATNDGAVTAALPHPFFFHTPRTTTGTASGLRREELVAHLQAFYIVRPARRLEIAVSAGPSFFRVRQDAVNDLAFGDVYPYDTPTFTSASAVRISGRKTGFNVGVDVGRRLVRHAGIGGSVRFSRAHLSLDLPNGQTPVSIDAGGAQIAGGLRLFF